MSKRGGIPGGMIPGGRNNMLKQAQRMQKQMEESAKELEEKEFTATAGGGAVSVAVSGTKELKAIKLDKEAVDPDDVETLQDMIVLAINDAMKQVDEVQAASIGRFTGGLSGLF